MLKPIYENIPDDLKQNRQWVNWKSVTRKEGEKPTKPPFMPSGELARTDDPATWSHFLTAKAAASQFDGIGYVLAREVKGIMKNAITRNTADLERLEGIIRRNLQSFYEVGRALMEIRDKGLYRDVLGFETFEAYVKVRWDMSRRHAYRLIDSAMVVETVSPMGDKKPEIVKCDQLVTPATESQARPLARLAPEQQKEAWTKAISTAPEGKVTAAHVAKIVKEMSPRGDKELERELQEKAEKEEIRVEMRMLRRAWRIAPDPIKAIFLSWIRADEKKLPTGAKAFADFAIEQLRRITDDDPDREVALRKMWGWLDSQRSTLTKYCRANALTGQARMTLLGIHDDDNEVLQKMDEMIRFCEELKTKAKGKR